MQLTSSERFDQFIGTQLAEAVLPRTTLDFDAELALWHRNLDIFYKFVESSLSPYVEDGRVLVRYGEVQIREALIGVYRARCAQLHIGRDEVTLTPVGTLLRSSRGQINMKGPHGSARFVVVPPEVSRRWTRADNPLWYGEPGDENSAPETWIWKLAMPQRDTTFIHVDAEFFQEALMGVTAGICLDDDDR
ncbi:hypothetical protein PIN31115_03108 [Pandoraea iniqua]|uniref:Uncharacterized protein n=1 Tax=Pandoraea iniqua TaxID=2508288 RepID=A0A5E4WA49_9BURK|nr:hypothetical protein [Pandoraea iniqua]VVE20484.1 hypothetical protein PIN31115_03108 [Pandoraea iniqua]